MSGTLKIHRSSKSKLLKLVLNTKNDFRIDIDNLWLKAIEHFNPSVHCSPYEVYAYRPFVHDYFESEFFDWILTYDFDNLKDLRYELYAKNKI